MKSNQTSKELAKAFEYSQLRIAKNERQIEQLEEQIEELRRSDNSDWQKKKHYILKARSGEYKIVGNSMGLKLTMNEANDRSIIDQWWFVVLQGLIAVVGTLGVLYFIKNFL